MPNCNFWLIGDKSNKKNAESLGIKFETINNLSTSIDYDYQHQSKNGADYEKFCIDRWIILHNFIAKTKIKEALYLDSDTLILSDKILDVFYDTKYDLIKENSLVTMPCVIFFKEKAIRLFKDYILKLYSLSTQEKITVLKSISDRVQQDKNRFHISDMYLIGDFANKWSRLRTLNNPGPLEPEINIKNVFFNKENNEHRGLICHYTAKQLKQKTLKYKEKSYFHQDKEVPFLHLQGESKDWQPEILKQINNEQDINLDF
tara:strand:- start:83 stop:862 length:780 start_codon:yes stop_codon:yes gene_type:complete